MDSSVRVSRSSPLTPHILAVRFEYDERILSAVKAVPGRTWNTANKVWLIPSTPENIRTLKAALPRGTHLMVESALLASLEQQETAIAAAQQVRDAGDSAIDFPFVTTPYAHQRAGLDFLAKLGSGALLWEMGLGKTKTAIDYAEYLRSEEDSPTANFRVLVICPNTVKRNWADEIRTHAGHSSFAIPTGSIERRAREFGATRYTIVNCETLSYPLAAKALQMIPWDLIVVDESTRFKTPSARRTKTLLKLRAKHRLILTGTPITGKPMDAWSQLEFVSPGVFGTFTSFKDRYLELDFFKRPVGIKPGQENDLAARIGARAYRILKADVLDLPPKVYTERVVELTGDQEKAYRQMKTDLRVELEGMQRVTAQNILTHLLRLTQITAGFVGESPRYTWIPDNAKIRELDDLLNDELAGEQVVIFGQYQFELEQLAARYAGDRPLGRPDSGDGGGRFQPHHAKELPPIIYGPTNEQARHEFVQQFQEGRRRLLFCQNRTGGIGINLTAAQTAIYFTRSWSLEEWLQSQDRLHRIGQRGTVSIVSLIADKTIDLEISKALAEKQNVADFLTGDKARSLAARLLGG